MSPAKAILFDLDGTLLDTLQDLTDSGNEVLKARGFPPHSLCDYRRFVGSGMAQLVHDIFPVGNQPTTEDEVQTILREYRDAYARNWKNTTQPYPDIPETLDQLFAREIPCGVVSNKPHDYTLLCVDTFLGRWPWGIVLGHRAQHPRKPDPDGALEAAGKLGVAPADCLFVGDSDVDMQTAVNAEMRGIGVTWGFRDPEELLAAGAERIVKTGQELLELV